MSNFELSDAVKNDYIEQLYNCFSSGRDFELFLNYFLQKIGFEEVVTTRYIGDKGIDLTCVKKGIDVSGIDTMNYYIQAKRYKPSNKVQASEIRDLKGSTKYDKNGNVLNCNFINVLITTSDFTRGAIEEANSNPNFPTILINGEKLLEMCIDKGIGFVFNPVFVKDEITKLIASQTASDNNSSAPVQPLSDNCLVCRAITANDIRARILIIPQVIKNTLKDGDATMNLNINGIDYSLNIDKGQRYLGGVTEIYRQCGLISDDNIYISKQAKWNIVDDKIFLVIE